MRPFGFYHNPVLNESMPVWRAPFVKPLILLGFLALIIKALYLQGLSTQFLQEHGVRRFVRMLVLPPTRGKVLDRSGEVVLGFRLPVRGRWRIPGECRYA